MKFKRIYLEITNVCNLQCSFCHGTVRPPRFLSPAEFDLLCGKLEGATEYLYLHLMGEPLLHPALGKLLCIAAQHFFRVNLTTNAVLLPEAAQTLCSSPALHRVNLSLQAWEGNFGMGSLENYVNQCADFARRAAAAGVIVSLRLWNGGGAEEKNGEILSLLRTAFPGQWVQAQRNTVLADRVFLEFGETFDWPDIDAPERGTAFCHGLRDHMGVLCDGTAVPCCLDADGALALGNLFTQTLEEILASPRAQAIYNGFSRRIPSEALCRRCGYAARF